MQVTTIGDVDVIYFQNPRYKGLLCIRQTISWRIVQIQGSVFDVLGLGLVIVLGRRGATTHTIVYNPLVQAARQANSILLITGRSNTLVNEVALDLGRACVKQL